MAGGATAVEGLSRLGERPLFMIGAPGVGKSTTGLLLSAKLERRFVDLDATVEAEAQMTVAEIFQHEGEQGFRQREATALRRVALGGSKVVAVGGGAPMHHENLPFMLQAGLVICLTASLDELVLRLADTSTRPLLEGAELRQRLERLLSERTSAYRQAPIAVDTTGRAPSQVVRAILEAIGRPGDAPRSLP